MTSRSHDHEHNHNHNPDFPSTLQTVYEKCQQSARLTNPTHAVLLEQSNTKFLCVWAGLQPTLAPPTLRSSLGQTLLGLESFRLIQVVGDSSSGFTSLGRQTAKDVIVPLITDDKTAVLEYGYTATRHDANWVVNDILAEMPEVRPRAVANVVYRSLTAVESWGCEATANVERMVLVYDEGETEFGSDMWVSDGIMAGRHGDVLVCLEGGPQAFAQAVGVCMRGVEIVVVTGPGMRESKAAANFSAGWLLKILCDEFSRCTDGGNVTTAEKERMQRAATAYLDGIDTLKGQGGHKKYEAIQANVETLMDAPEHLKGVRIRHVA